MAYILTAITSIVSGVLVFILQSVIKENREMKKEKDEATKTKQDALENGVLCLLRVKLIEHHTKYMKRGSISTHGLENWGLMYEAYKGLGGNGMVDHMKAEIEELHID